MAKRVVVPPPEPLGSLLIRTAHGERDAACPIVGDRVAKSLKEVADFFGVQPNTVKTGWRKLGGMPGGEGKWPLAAILDWKLQRDVVPRTEAAAGGDDAERKSSGLDGEREADARKSEADAHAKELKNQVVEGNVLFRDDVEPQLAEFLTAADDNFMRLPRSKSCCRCSRATKRRSTWRRNSKKKSAKSSGN